MNKQNLPAVSILDDKTLEDFKTSDSVVLVAYFGADDKSSNETFSSVAESLRDSYIFGAINNADAAAADGVKQPAIVLYKTFDEGKDTFDESFDKEAIAKWAKAAATPLVGEVGPDTYQGYMSVSLQLSDSFRLF
jgi:protein disulfide-isomerase A1